MFKKETKVGVGDVRLYSSIPQRRKCPVHVIIFTNSIVELGIWVHQCWIPFTVIINIFITYLLSAQYQTKCFSCIASFNPYITPRA